MSPSRQRPSPHRLLTRLVAMGVLLAPGALAHIDLEAPLPREQGRGRAPNSNLKQGPCGQVDNGRTSKVSVFEPGETIEVTWAETTNHRSYYRIAFDSDGDDAFPTFAGPGIGAEGIDPRALCPVDGQVILAYDLQDGAGGRHTSRVRLPDVECERCTLQVVQYMFDTTRPYYFQCADLALRRGGSLDAGAPDAAAGEAIGPQGSPDAGATPHVAAPGCWDRIAPLDAGLPASRPGSGERESTPSPSAPPAAGGDLPSRPPVPPPAPPGPRRDSGCALAGAPAAPAAGALMALLGLCSALRRRRATRRT